MADAKPRWTRRRITEFAGIALVLAAIAGAVTLSPRTRDHAVVLVTVEDCRRAFSEAACRTVVDRAQAIHADTAPSFEAQATCELVYGQGHCTMLMRQLIALNRYAPRMIAILTTKDQSGVVPLYDAPESKPSEQNANAGRLVFYRGAPVGRLMQPKIGGADAPYVADDKGDALTAAAVRALHGP